MSKLPSKYVKMSVTGNRIKLTLWVEGKETTRQAFVEPNGTAWFSAWALATPIYNGPSLAAAVKAAEAFINRK